jgi:CRISPR-associated protein Csy2
MSSSNFIYNGYLVIPKLRVQNANCISAPLTWGFPALTGFSGCMVALERKLGTEFGVKFERFGVVCHKFDPQTNRNGYETRFNLTRNPLNESGETSAFNEEGRAHLEITLIFKIRYDQKHSSKLAETAESIAEVLTSMRIAGGTILPRTQYLTKNLSPAIYDDDDYWPKNWRHLRNKLLPGFFLVSAHDKLIAREKLLKAEVPENPLLEAWLYESRLNIKYSPVPKVKAPYKEVDVLSQPNAFEWLIHKRAGWIVPIPVGFTAIAPIQEPGSVANVRDKNVPFQFVEAIYSLGEWVSPHRIKKIDSIFWASNPPDAQGQYLLSNSFK